MENRWTIKTILPIKIHPFFCIVAFISVITGYLKAFLLFSLLIWIHECGHVIAAFHYKWKIASILILPFGGLTTFQEKINRPIHEELWIACFGPLFQIICYQAIVFFFGYDPLLEQFHYAILCFNLLPIYPLDGSKILWCLFSYYFPFKRSHQLMLFCSFVCFFFLFFILLFHFQLFFCFVIVLLCIRGVKECRNHQAFYHKFLLERFLYPFSFPHTKIILGIQLEQMKRNCYHFFYDKGSYYKERDILKEKFDFSTDLW